MANGMCKLTKSAARCVFVYALILSILVATSSSLRAQAPNPIAPAKLAPTLGSIKSISANLLVVTTDGGSEVRIQLPSDVKLVRFPPGSKDLKEATPIQLNDLQVGDRVLVQLKPSDDPNSPLAVRVVAMKKADITEKQTKEREEWQRHGIGGLVKFVDVASGAITISTLSATGPKDVVIHVGSGTILRRYAPGSVKFDDAKTAPITEVQPGDQLRARGTRGADGSDFTADEIVSGSFRNIGGTVTAVDASAGTLTVNDFASKKQVELKITSDSQLRKLPPMIAQRIAARLKGEPAAPGAASAQSGAGTPPTSSAPAGGNGGGGTAAPGGPGAGAGRSPGGGGGDMQQMLSRLPASTLSDFQKGDAVMIVASSGQASAQSTVITLLGGVEPILQSSPQGQAASILSPWTMSQGGSGDAGTP
jgi:hypothetical protein